MVPMNPWMEVLEEKVKELVGSAREAVVCREFSSLIRYPLRPDLDPKNPSKDSHNAPTEYLDWAGKKENVKCVHAVVPPSILDDAELIDVRISGKGPDDKFYNRDKTLRDRVARGNCILQLKLKKSRSIQIFLVHGMKKFTGGLGDEDITQPDSSLTWQKYFIKPMEDAKEVICLEKANGEAAHLSAVSINGTIFICAGSKNVHMLFQNQEQISLYKDSRYQYARDVAYAVIDLIERKMDPEGRDLLLKFLAFTGFTAVLELLHPKHQHVEDFSCLKEPLLKFIAWTAPPSGEGGKSLTALPPDVGLVLAKALQLDPVSYEIIPASQVEQKIIEIRGMTDREGFVLYFLDEHDQVIGMLKKKTTWYVILRACREKLKTAARDWEKNQGGFSLSEHIKKMEKRISEIRNWLDFDSSVEKHWKDLTCCCLKWTVKQLKMGSISSLDIAERFPDVWTRFQKD